jgi:hypothetical protein
MKQFHFLENDYDCPDSQDSIREAKTRLWYAGFKPFLEKMKIHYQFHLMEKDKIYDIIFNPNNILVTFSVYVQGSDSTFLNLIASAGRNGIKGITYIDTSGALVDFLNKVFIYDVKNFRHVVAGVNSNNIITFDADAPHDECFKRIRIEFDDVYGDCVKLKYFNLNDQIS